VNAAPYLLVAYLLGSLPFALWAGRAARGIDLRQHGSGNLGATNVLRLLGPGWGAATLLLDVGKGFTATALLPGWFGLGTVGEGSAWPLAGCAAAVVGHTVSPLAGFRGGKGVATTLGGFLALAPLAALLGLGGFVLTVAFSRYVSLGSLVMAIAFPLAALRVGPPPPLRAAVVALGVALAVLVAWRHRANWARIAAGTESRFRWRDR
jgi:glycerol-3-phosphate acyltransferase PlsY